MLKSSHYATKFKEASETGTQVLWLKATKQCDCHDPDSLINSEPDPRCKKCFGTGMQRNVILTSKIRNQIQNQRAESFEETTLNTTINERRLFFIPEFYRDMSTTDLIVFLDTDLTPVSLYKVINKEQFRVEDFIFYEIVGNKMNFLEGVSTIFKDRDMLLTISEADAGKKEIGGNI